MRKISFTFLILLIFLNFLLFSCASEAAISEQAVNSAWGRLAEKAGIAGVSVTYEDKKEPNAWVAFKSSSNFSLHVTKGLMAVLENEHQIAGILGHEIGHVKCGHYNQTVTRNLMLAIAQKLLSGKNTAVNTAVNLGVGLAQGGFSREQEVQADDWGAALAVSAGYSAWGLYDAMNAMKKAGFVTSDSILNGFNSHPPTDRRLERLSARATEAVSRQQQEKEAQAQQPQQAQKKEPPTQEAQKAMEEAKKFDDFKNNLFNNFKNQSDDKK